MTYLEFLHRLQLRFLTNDKTESYGHLCILARDIASLDDQDWYGRFVEDICEFVDPHESFETWMGVQGFQINPGSRRSNYATYTPMQTYYRRLEVLNILIEREEAKCRTT